MNWQGKALGAVVGAFAAGPAGALFGAFIGHLYDAQATVRPKPIDASGASSVTVEQAFFRAVFQVMGHLAKSDGRVTEQEIAAARAIMREFRLGDRETRYAMDLFREGKAAAFPLESHLRELRELCGERTDLCRMFVQIQVQVALWGESLDAAGRNVLARVCSALGVSAYEVIQMEALLRMQQSRPRDAAASASDRVAAAYEVLGVSPAATDAEVTQAYRRLMNQNHPDKLHAKGLPESMMKLAADKTRQIRQAYEAVREARKKR